MEAAAQTTTNGKHVTPPTLSTSIRDLDVSLIDVGEQPRKVFRGIEELAGDIARRGLLEPVLVRPKKKGRFELVFGERRLRATKLAKLSTIPAMIRELSDAEALEIQVVENGKREDIHPLEEADAFQTLHEKHGYSQDEIAAKVGKSLATVQARMRLCGLVPEVRKAFLDGTFGIGVALLFSRLPHADLQKKALKEVLDRGRDGREPISLSDAGWVIKQRYALRLAEAPFDTADGALVKGATACSECPKRTGKQTDLFGQKEDDDLCLDTKCFEAKKKAGWEKRVALAKEKDQKVISEKEAKELFHYGGSTLARDAKYVDLDAKNYDDPKYRTNRSLLGKAAADLPIAIVRDATGTVHELVPTDAYRKAAKSAGLKAPVQAAKKTEMSVAEKRRRTQEAKKREAEKNLVAKMVASAAKKQPNERFWRAMARAMVRMVWHDSQVAVAARRELEIPKSESSSKVLCDVASKMSASDARALCVELAITASRGDTNLSLKELRAALGVR